MYALFFCLSLFLTLAAHAMELVLKNKEIITYGLAPFLDRQDRATLRIINKNFAYYVQPQLHINEQYKIACTKNNIAMMDELRKKGALLLYEEAYQLFLNNKKDLILKIVPYNENNVSAIFLYSVQRANPCFMKWLLRIVKPKVTAAFFQNTLNTAHALWQNSVKKNVEIFINQLKVYKLLNKYFSMQCQKTMPQFNEIEDHGESIDKDSSNCTIS